jgi:hypothetical protein
VCHWYIYKKMSSLEHRQFLIGRFDRLYDSINNKGNVFLAVNIFLIGGLFTVLIQLPNYLKQDGGAIFWVVLMLAVNLGSIIFTLLSLIPYTRSSGMSLVFFGDIAELDRDEFLNKFVRLEDGEIRNDLDQQIYYLAKGLKKKFAKLFVAGTLLLLETLTLVPLVICVILNLK